MILVVTNDSPWPALTGGRARVAGLVEALGTRHDLRVLVARGRRPLDVAPPAVPLPPCRAGRLSTVLGRTPRLGAGLLGPDAVAQVHAAAVQASAVLVTHTYLAPALAGLPAPLVLDLPNLEVDRPDPGGRLLDLVERRKARRWEPAAVRGADLCCAVDEHDAAVVRGWGAARVVVVPNAPGDVPVSPPSPPDGTVLAVGDWRYGPNRDGLKSFLARDWPRISEAVPGRRLVLAGRGSEDHPGGLGRVEDLTPLYDSAAVVVAPATSGAGTQLKVVEAVARGRVVVSPPYGARSLPPGLRGLCPSGDVGALVVALLDDVADRHRREAALRAADLPRTWAQAAAPLVTALAAVADG